MAIYSYSNLKSRFNTYIKANFLQLITGVILNGILHDIVDSVTNWLSFYVPKADAQSGRVVVVESGTEVIFTSPFPEGTNYIILPYCFNNEGTVAFTITNESNTGFTVTPVTDAIFVYRAEKI